ncbi:hypothetical protein [Pseudoxanthomonas sp. JBR18]|uniref:hypothetical protein n=1 Tax=Pseudoxanthomonas sp. JBR18 TaxID=2969308 RepID=UPI002306131F|nr:hypothetical protein [Pseudoxanthomonas sp. JBR18]WCE05768.1 hypothetical protein PJ250_07430 [Pseudoxanthomonas sp. JBR18]
MDEAGRRFASAQALRLAALALFVIPLTPRQQPPWFEPWLLVPALGIGLLASGLAIAWRRDGWTRRGVAYGLFALHLLLAFAAAWLSQVPTFG